MEQQRKYDMGGIGSARVGRLNSPFVTEILSLWLPALIVGLLILGGFPFRCDREPGRPRDSVFSALPIRGDPVCSTTTAQLDHESFQLSKELQP
jgi:hypothetical protein